MFLMLLENGAGEAVRNKRMGWRERDVEEKKRKEGTRVVSRESQVG